MIPEPYNTFRQILLLLLFSVTSLIAHAQQDVEFRGDGSFLKGKNIIKVKRDFGDPYLWALTDNNEIYRLNSLTKDVDDYTDKFKAYSYLKFVDIAGISKDTVFIATNADKLLELKYNDIKVISATDGVRGNINSIGHMYWPDYAGPGSGSTYFSIYLAIATNHGFCRYDFKKEQIIEYRHNDGDFEARIFESTYRRIILNSDYVHNPVNGGENYAVWMEHLSGIIVYPVWISDIIGRNVKSAYYTVVNDRDNYSYSLSSLGQYWATEKGLFVKDGDGFKDANTNRRSYLQGVQINKITSIYGLTSFKPTMQSPGLEKENLLVGANDGLYYSTSDYQNYGQLNSHSFYKYTPLNNKKVNDICVNGIVPFQYPNYCEDGAWIATNDGLYLIRPDYGKFLNTQTLTAVQFKNKPNVNQVELCGSLTETAVVNGYTTMIYEWYKDGVKIEGNNSNELAIKAAGVYHAILYDPCSGVNIKTNTVKVTQTAGPTFTFNYPDKINTCDKQSVNLTANGSTAYSYRWYKDGVLTGNTTNTLAANSSGKYKVEVSACPDSWVASKEVQVNFIDLPVTTLAADKPVYCAGEQAKLTINIPVSPKYNIYWLRDGVVVNEYTNAKEVRTTIPGTYIINVKSTVADATCMQPSQSLKLEFTSAPVFAFNYQDVERTCAGKPFELKVDANPAYNYRWFKNNVQISNTTNALSVTQSGDYRVELSACSGTWVPSKTVKVNVISNPAVTLSTNKTAYCIGDMATLFINISPSADYTIRWWRNSDPVLSATNQRSLETDQPGQYNVTVEAPGLAGCTQISPMRDLTFQPVPTLNIEQVVNTTLCEGSTVDLKAIYPAGIGGGIRWSTGQTGDVLKVTRSGTYTAELNTPAGCIVTANITVNLLPNPILNLADAQLCPYDNEQITLIAPSGYVKYVWNGQQGGTSYTVSKLGNVSITVTDVNGCTATQTIRVTNKCDDVKIPNAFTPNGDGINDTWNISGIEGDGSVTVKIYNRSGVLIFDSIGYSRPWDGTYRGQQLPVGTYYYVIRLKNSSQVLSGSVAILR